MAHEHGDRSRDCEAAFVGTAQSFRVNGRNAARDRLQVHAGATGEIGKGVELEHACTGEIAGGQDVHAGFSRVIWRW